MRVICLSALQSLFRVLGERGSLTGIYTYIQLIDAASATSYVFLQHLWPFCVFSQAGV